ncbi:MAG: hypothetical protein VX278_08945 [Myxococcota bacterium]|nr:hypothetical protein [Myxococcota bacterium]
MSDEKSDRFSSVPKRLRKSFKGKLKDLQQGTRPIHSLISSVNKLRKIEGSQIPSSGEFLRVKDYHDYIQAEERKISVQDYSKAHKEHLQRKRERRETQGLSPLFSGLTSVETPSRPTVAPAKVEAASTSEETVSDGGFDFMLDALDDEISAEETVMQENPNFVEPEQEEGDDGASFDFMLDGLEDEPEASREEASQDPIQQSDDTKVAQPYHRLNEIFQGLKSNFEQYKSQLGQEDAMERFEAEGIALLDDFQTEIFDYENWSLEKQQNWKESQFLFLLDKISQFYSYVCKRSFEGEDQAGAIRNELQSLLYGDLNQSCIELDWFQIEPLVPYRSYFSAEQQTIDSENVSAELKNIILSVEHVGLLDAKGDKQVRVAQVIVGI